MSDLLTVLETIQKSSPSAHIDPTYDPMCIVVEQVSWRIAAAIAREAGFKSLAFLTAVDHESRVRITALLTDAERAAVMLSTDISTGDSSAKDHRDSQTPLTIESLTQVFKAALWHERETAEMFGIDFHGHPDLRPLLLRDSMISTPLRRHVGLSDRINTVWPGAAAADPTADKPRRTPPSPGVQSSWTTKDGRNRG